MYVVPPGGRKMHGSLGLGRRILIVGMEIGASILGRWVGVVLEVNFLGFAVGWC